MKIFYCISGTGTRSLACLNLLSDISALNYSFQERVSASILKRGRLKMGFIPDFSGMPVGKLLIIWAVSATNLPKLNTGWVFHLTIQYY
jgi:hypothetical protein